jgi:uncharacterized membrane protein
VGTRGLLGNAPDGRAFLKDADTFTSFDYPGALFTYGNGINDDGVMVGQYRQEFVVGPNTFQDFDHGLIIDGTTLTAFDFPGASSTEGNGINNAGQIVGTCWPQSRLTGPRRDAITGLSVARPY